MEQSEVRLLLDTHAWFWWMMNSDRLPAGARKVIGDTSNETFVSAVSVYELIRKYHIGKLPEMKLLAENVEREIDLDGFSRLDVTTVHAAKAAALPQGHRDPFDRLLMAQALCENVPLISNEEIFDSFGVRRLW